jgi:HSP20 family protein
MIKERRNIAMTLTKFKDNKTSFPYLMDTLLGRDLFDLGNTSPWGNSLPAVNIKETKDSFVVDVAAPGMSKEDFKIKLDNSLLVISSEKQMENKEEGEDGQYTRREFSYQSFQRSFTLPQTVERDNITAAYRDGILSITVPKKEEAKLKPAKEIQIS